jgi:hypothetical protein
MRRAIWMALAFMGTAPLVALAQQNTGAQAPAGSPSGTTSIDRGQDTNAQNAPGAPGQQSAGSVGTAQGQPANGAGGTFGGTGGSGAGSTGGVGGDAMGASGGGGGGGGVGVGAGGGGTGGGGMTGGQTGTGAAGATSGPTYRGTSEQPGNTDTGTVGAGGGTGGAGQGNATGGGSGAGGGGQASAQQAPLSGDAMQRELLSLRERVARLEGQVRDMGRGTGGSGTGGGGTTDTSNVRAKGPTVVATVTFDGTVRSVTSNRIQVVDGEDGSVYNMRIDRGTRVVDDGQAINPRQLSEGTPVRASLAFISGEEHARDIVVIDEETQQRQQQEQQRQRQEQQRPRGVSPGQRLIQQPQAAPRTQGGLPGSSTR